MALVTAQELMKYMGGLKLRPDQVALVESVILPGIQGELETHLNRKLQPVMIRETLYPDDRGYLVFSEAPVWEVLGVTRTSDGTAISFPPPQVVEPVPMVIPEKYTNIVETTIDRSGLGIDATPYMMPAAGEGLLGFQGVDYTSVMGYASLDQYFPRIGYICQYVGGYAGGYDAPLKLGIIRVAAREVERMFDNSFSLRDATAGQAEASDGGWRMALKGWEPAELDSWNRLRRRVIL